MNILKARQNPDKSYSYYLQGQGKTLTEIPFVEYEDHDGLFTVVKKDNDFWTYLPVVDGVADTPPTFLPLWKILNKGVVVYLIA